MFLTGYQLPFTIIYNKLLHSTTKARKNKSIPFTFGIQPKSMKNRFPILLFFLISYGNLFGQDSILRKDYEEYKNQSRTYEKVALYAEALKNLDLAIDLAKQEEWKEEELKCHISKAEIKRKAGDFQDGYEILIGLKGSHQFPKTHVRKLERIVALIQAGGLGYFPENEAHKIEKTYLDSGIYLAQSQGFDLELAGLYNLRGFGLRGQDKDSSLQYFKQSAKLFIENGDTQNYVVAKTNEIRVYVDLQDSLNAVNTFTEINRLLNKKAWYRTETTLYQLMFQYFAQGKDTSLTNYWKMRFFQSMYLHDQRANNDQMMAYRTLHETQKYRDEAQLKGIALENEAKSKKQLYIYFGILGILSLGIGILFFRERKLKRDIKKANTSYEMLLVESNHRIKNNLQMIISMLEYSGKSLKNENSMAFKNMSGKIHTISVLHKHLYLDVHNGKVELASYFKDIVALYLDFSSSAKNINKSIASCSISSERIVYFGLILNEMLSNSMEHGKSTNMEIEIVVEKHEKGYIFSYQDYSFFDPESKDGTGITLIKQLIKRVEASQFSLDPEKGKYQFKFYA